MMKMSKRFPIGAWRHYNSFDEDCQCDLCDEYQTWRHNKWLEEYKKAND